LLRNVRFQAVFKLPHGCPPETHVASNVNLFTHIILINQTVHRTECCGRTSEIVNFEVCADEGHIAFVEDSQAAGAHNSQSPNKDMLLKMHGERLTGRSHKCHVTMLLCW